MNAMHYAVFFDAPEVVEALADQTPSLVMGACSEFNNGNSLHIAAANLSLESAKILVSRIDLREVAEMDIFCCCLLYRLSMTLMALSRITKDVSLMNASQNVSLVCRGADVHLSCSLSLSLSLLLRFL